jgi:dTDP-L-rhamnose 4-epimerase
MSGETLDLKGLTCLVTGGAGMIGSHIVRLLLDEHKCKVKVLDALKVVTHPSGEKPYWVPDEVEFIKGDASDRKTVEKCMQGVDVVFHQAAAGYEAALPNCLEKCFTDAAMSTCVIFDVIKDLKIPVKKVVVASSMAVYGEASYRRKDGSEFIPDGYRPDSRLAAKQYEVIDEKGEECTSYPIKETRPLQPPHPYHLAKYCQEKISLAAGNEQNLSTTALRYSIVHGPHQSVHNPYTGVMSIFCTRIMNGKNPVVFEDGKQTRDFMFAEDVARANIFVAKDPRSKGEAYNVGTGRGGDTMHKVATILCDLLKDGKDIKPEYHGDFRNMDTRHIQLDASKLMALGWKPQVTLEEGLKRHAEWAKEQAKKDGGVEDKFEKAYKEMISAGVIKRQKLN